MDDDNADLVPKLSPEFTRYARLYPSVIPRLREILASRDPKIRQRVDALRQMIAGREAALQEGFVARFQLTPTEARLALHLVEGGDIASYARGAGVTQGTARSQLKSIFAKTGVRKQAELIRLGREAG